MLGPFSQRLLTLLQLTRMALVVTAVADMLAAYLLRTAANGEQVEPGRLVLLALVSIGLYGFGMSLNDIVDQRRDAVAASDRPLPSGRIGVRFAHVVCVLLGWLALLAGVFAVDGEPTRRASLVALVATFALIAFYDVAGKYLVAVGLLALGLIRGCHVLIAAPDAPVLWHPLLLLNHVALLSLAAYALEQKRPTLTRVHALAVAAGLAVVNGGAVFGAMWSERAARAAIDAGWRWPDRLAVTPALVAPAAAAVGFWVAAGMVLRIGGEPRSRGKQLMLLGLLWLIVYDAAFVAGHVGPAAGLALLALLPIGWGSVRVMRAWARVAALAQRPAYLRAR